MEGDRSAEVGKSGRCDGDTRFFTYTAEESKVEGFNGETTMTRIPGEVIKALNGQKVPLALSSSTRGESP